MKSYELVAETIRGNNPGRTPVYGWIAWNLDWEHSQWGDYKKFEDEYEFDMAHIFGGPYPFDYHKIVGMKKEGITITPQMLLDMPLQPVDRMEDYDGIRKELEYYRGQRDVLALTLTATCVLSFICHAMYRQPAAWCHTVAIAGRTLWEWLAFAVVLLWVAYVENKLYGDKRPPLLVMASYALPFAVYTVLLLVNLFKGIIFIYTVDNRCETTWLYNIFMAIEVVCFLVPAFRARLYDQSAEKIRFLRVLPMMLPVAFGVGLQFFLPYQADVLGFAMGALLLYFSMAEEILYLDEESGLYNSGLLSYLFNPATAGKNETRSALILEADGHLPSCFEILRDTLHQTYDVIRLESKKFLMFSATDSRSALQLLATHVEEAVAKHNADHPDENVQMKVHSRVRTADEDSFAFIRSVVEDKDAGDPVRGVVSMISELDRLDQELKLAADIQLSMLPMNFPAFPDRKEFELYASMTPAKEVGGDFFDFFLIDPDHLALVIADVSGKGITDANGIDCVVCNHFYPD